MTSSTPFGSEAPQYQHAGISCVPLNGKAPIVKGWAGYRDKLPDQSTFDQWVTAYPNCNIGVVAGQQSGVAFVDIDVEDSSVVEAIVNCLPYSPWVRVGKKGCVLAFQYQGIKSFKIKDINGKALVEFFSTSGQVVVPPSIHPDTKMPYVANAKLHEVVDELLPLPGDLEAGLRQTLSDHGYQLKEVGTVKSKAKGKIAAGGRDEWITNQAGWLSYRIQSGSISLKNAQDQITTSISEDMEQPEGDVISPEVGREKLLRFLLSDLEKMDCKELPLGWNYDLEQQFLDSIGLGSVATTMMSYEQLIESFVFVKDTESFYDIETLERYSFSQFNSYFQDVKDYRDLSLHVLGNKRMRRAQGVRYVPEAGRLIESPRRKITYLNLWLPSEFVQEDAAQSVEESEVRPFLEHMAYLIPNNEERNHLLCWMAHMVQCPAERVNHAILLVGDSGTGKNWLSDLLIEFAGKHNSHVISTDDLKNAFNDWIEAVLLVVVEEVMAFGRRDVTNRCKQYITQPNIRVNAKNIRQYDTNNCARFFLTSNYVDALVLEDDDRRFFVLHSPAEAREEEYFDQLFLWRDQNISNIYSYLMGLDISDFNPNARPPVTQAKLEMIGATKPDVDSFLAENIQAQVFPFDLDVVFPHDIQQVLKDAGIGYVSSQKIKAAIERLGGAQLRQMRLGGSGRWFTGNKHAVVRSFVVRNVQIWQQTRPVEIKEYLRKGDPISSNIIPIAVTL
jgi:hypothetical protein